MSRNLPDDVPNSAFDEDPNFLKDKPEDFCPWCDHRLAVSDGSFLTKGVTFCGNVDCADYYYWESQERNRARYVRQSHWFKITEAVDA